MYEGIADMQGHVGKSRHVVSFWTPLPTQKFSQSPKMTSDVSRHGADMTQHVAVWAQKNNISKSDITG
jgi:hypothetical protein